jgi:hypothetical protein
MSPQENPVAALDILSDFRAPPIPIAAYGLGPRSHCARPLTG